MHNCVLCRGAEEYRAEGQGGAFAEGVAGTHRYERDVAPWRERDGQHEKVTSKWS